MANISARSPYIVTINEANQTETKIELFIWNGTGSAPATPTYTLSKLAPSPTSVATHYNISSYIREFLSFATFQNQFDDQSSYTSGNSAWSTAQWCNIEIKKYFKTTGGFSQVGGTESHICFDGYTLYEEGYNYNQGTFLLKQRSYQYLYSDPGNLGTQTFLSTYPFYRPGSLFLYAATNTLSARYINLKTNAQTDVNFTTSGFYVVPRVRLGNYADGNILQLRSGGFTLHSMTFKPKSECKYTPVVVDFVNRYGAWQREYFFKASKTNIEVQNSEYNLLQQTFPNYSTGEGMRKTFNTKYSEKITVNTDWVSEDFSDVLRELMTSERIFVNDKPAKIGTKNIELQKHINTKMINYTLEFEFAYEINNLVV